VRGRMVEIISQREISEGMRERMDRMVERGTEN
jgi:hypothetical protein